jgi:hypothetical protein
MVELGISKLCAKEQQRYYIKKNNKKKPTE